MDGKNVYAYERRMGSSGDLFGRARRHLAGKITRLPGGEVEARFVGVSKNYAGAKLWGEWAAGAVKSSRRFKSEREAVEAIASIFRPVRASS